MKKIPLFFTLFFAVAFNACSGPDTAASYGEKFCACVEKHNGPNQECMDLIEEAEKKFPNGNEEFMKTADKCMN